MLVPWSVWLGARIQSLPPVRKWGAITLRAVILSCAVLALAGTELVRTQDQLAVYFLLDHSHSVPAAQREVAAAELERMTEGRLDQKNEAGLIIFGRESSIERKPASTWGLRDVQSVVDGEDTDIAGAMRLAVAAFPQGYMRRIVLLSDGNETRGAALEEAKAAWAHGIAVDVLPIATGGEAEARIREVTAPRQAGSGEPVQLRVVVHSNVAGTGTLYLAQRSGAGAGGMRAMLDPQRVSLQPGDNVYVVNQELPRAGLYEFEARIEMEGDSIAENNTGRAFTTVLGEPQVLLVEATPDDGEALAQALAGEGVEVTRINPADFPSSPARLQAYEGIVLANVSSNQLSSGQLSLLQALVRDQGTGLTMVGGPSAFGAGGYLDTPVEEALPVSMDIKQRKAMPSCALMLVIDKSGSMEGEKVLMAKRAAIAAVELLSTKDYIGVIGFDVEPHWVVKVQEASEKSGIIRAIGTLGAGGGTSMYPALVEAHEALSQISTNLRHCIVLSDGLSNPDHFVGILGQMAAEKITVSTVGVGQDADQQLLMAIAHWGGGRYYFTNNPHDIPKFFTREALIIRKHMLLEEEFTPAPWHDSELLAGLEAGLPTLQGYVVTTAKDNATVPLVSHEGDPILAHWRYGLGKSLAFTSDATTRWGADWLGWGGFGRFWAQNVRWTLRAAPPADFRVETRVVDGEGIVRIDAVDEAGRFVNFLAPRGLVTTPDAEAVELDMQQTGPGVYEARFPIGGSGVYLANISYQDDRGRSGMIPTGIAVDYAREYAFHTTNHGWLETLAALGGGQVLGPGDTPFRHDLKASATIYPLWPYLLMAAACLLPVEIFLRRVALPWALLWVWCVEGLRRAPALRRLIPEPAPPPMPVTGVYRAAAAGEHAPAAASFGAVAPPAPPAPTAPDGEAPAPDRAAPGSPAPKLPGQSEYTSRLLDAKRRVQQQWQKDEDKEDDA
jgi:uncharacterized membrane protein